MEGRAAITQGPESREKARGFQVKDPKGKEKVYKISVCKDRERCSLQASLTLAVWVKGFGKAKNTPRVRDRESGHLASQGETLLLKISESSSFGLNCAPPPPPTHRRHTQDLPSCHGALVRSPAGSSGRSAGEAEACRKGQQ